MHALIPIAEPTFGNYADLRLDKSESARLALFLARWNSVADGHAEGKRSVVTCRLGTLSDPVDYSRGEVRR
jgi:hypothetical protein